MSRRSIIIDPDSIAAKILFVVGLLLIGLSVFLFIQKKQELDGLPTVEAVIVDTHSSGKRNNGDSYTIVEYEVRGQTYTYRFNSYSAFRDKGERITVAYNGDDPSEVYETGFFAYMIPLLAAIFGLAFMSVIRPFRWMRRKEFEWD